MNYIIVARVIVQNSANEVLILKRSEGFSNPGKYDLPGGKIDPGEQPIDGAIRELFEETGIKARVEDLQIVDSYCSAAVNETIWCDIIYRLNLTSSTDIILSSEHESSRFIDSSRLQDFDIVLDQSKAISNLLSSKPLD